MKRSRLPRARAITLTGALLVGEPGCFGNPDDGDSATTASTLGATSSPSGDPSGGGGDGGSGGDGNDADGPAEGGDEPSVDETSVGSAGSDGSDGPAGGGGDASGDDGSGSNCETSPDCPDGHVCAPIVVAGRGECVGAFDRSYAIVVDEFCLLGGTTAPDPSGDWQAEYFFEVKIDGAQVYEWRYYDDSASCVSWSAVPVEVDVPEGAVVEVVFWDFDPATASDKLASSCCADGIGCSCAPITEQRLQFGYDEEFDTDSSGWVSRNFSLQMRFVPL